MTKKFYAVKIGKTPGIYETWSECQSQINGVSGAVYKGFSTRQEALAFIDDTNIKSKQKVYHAEAVAYVDGSFDENTNMFSCGVVFFYQGKEYHFSKKFDDIELAEMNNVAGEIKGAELAMQYCLDKNIHSLLIYHDYEGIAKWCTGEWKAKKRGTIAYAEFYRLASTQIDIGFVKVKGHSGNQYNDLADGLARMALGLSNIKDTYVEEKKMSKNRGVYIDRDRIVQIIRDAGEKQWEEFTADELIPAGTAKRCNIIANGKPAMLNLYFNNDGTTTITPTGSNPEISSVIKALLESECKYTGNTSGKTYSIKRLPKEWQDKLLEYLFEIEGVSVEQNFIETVPAHNTYIFSSNFGDKLTINIYKTGTMTLQGKPAYLYGEAISFLSYCNNISIDDIVDSINGFHNIEVKTSEVRKDMEILMPRAYENLDDTILKLLSPSISLRKVQIDLEDYSCYAFPALRALEGYIKYLFGLKTVTVGHTFYKIFDGDFLCQNVADTIGDINYQRELEKLYVYLKNNRHVLFHADQIIIGTKLIEDRHEADEIINTVIHLIDTSYTNLFIK